MGDTQMTPDDEQEELRFAVESRNAADEAAQQARAILNGATEGTPGMAGAWAALSAADALASIAGSLAVLVNRTQTVVHEAPAADPAEPEGVEG